MADEGEVVGVRSRAPPTMAPQENAAGWRDDQLDMEKNDKDAKDLAKKADPGNDKGEAIFGGGPRPVPAPAAGLVNLPPPGVLGGAQRPPGGPGAPPKDMPRAPPVALPRLSSP